MVKVFVHGVPEVDAIWGPLLGALRSRGIHDVVTLSPPGFGAPLPENWVASSEQYRRWLIVELETLAGGGEVIDLVGHDWGAGHTFGVAATRPDLLHSWASDCTGPAIARAVAAGLDVEMGRCILGLYRSAVQPALRELGDQLAAATHRPTLVINPSDDPYVSADLAPHVADRIDAQLVTLEGVGHWWMVEQPEQVADALASFWSSP